MVGRHEGPRNLGEALSWYSRPEHAIARDSKRCSRAGMHGGHAAQEAEKPRLKRGGAADRQGGAPAATLRGKGARPSLGGSVRWKDP